jgi:3-hydroxyacyl-CoA dehydrogenase
MLNLGLSIEAVDQLTGPVIGRPKSASFRTADLVGLDTMVHVADNVYNGALQDEMRAMFKIPDFMQQMLAKNMLGEKTRQGFYKKTADPTGKPVILSLDYKNLEYSPQKKADFMSLEMAKNTKDVGEKLKSLFYANDLAGQFTFQTMTETLIYAANRVGEITDDLLSIDQAMQWGFAWEMGPFEIWDAIGLTSSLAKMRKSGYVIPAWVQALVDSGQNSFYKHERSTLSFYDLAARDYAPAPVKPGVILLPALKDRQKKVAGNQGASLVDLGDGVACFEFHTKMNAMGEEIITMLLKALEIVDKDFEGLIIANHGTNFSAGANLPLVLFMTQEEEWDELE